VEELELVRRAKAGDRAAVGALLSAHTAQAYRLALHIVRNQADAEDATQNAFVRAFTNLGRFDERCPFAPWLLRIVAREALKVLRAERTRFAFWQRQAQVERSQESVEDIVLVRVEHQELWRALNRLKTDDRVVLTLSYFVGLNEAELAETLGIKRGTVKSRKHNALARLRALVQRDFPELQDEVLGRRESEGASQ